VILDNRTPKRARLLLLCTRFRLPSVCVHELANDKMMRAANSKSGPIPVPNSNLPPGWEQLIDPRTGRTYYQNHITRSTQWEPPVAPPVAPVSAAATSLPPGWSENIDAKTGRKYYSNHITKTTQWERPTVSTAPMPPVNQQLPPGWVMLLDSRTGRYYYSNSILKKTQWERPTDGSSLAPSPPARASTDPVPQFSQLAIDESKRATQKDKVSKYDMYKSVLRAVLIDGQLNTAEEQMLSELRQQHGITYEEHERLLKECGVDAAKLAELKEIGHNKEKEKVPSKECVVCLDAEADHVVLDCFHMCMCETCASMLNKESDPKRKICPVCRGPIRDVKKVF